MSLERDPAFGRLGKIVLLTLVVGVFLRLSAEGMSTRVGGSMNLLSAFQPMGTAVCLFSSIMAAIDSAGSIRTRAFEFQHALPVTASELIRTRLGLFLMTGLIPLSLMTALLWPIRWEGVPHHALMNLSAGLAWAAWVGMCFACQPCMSRMRTGSGFFVCSLIAGALMVRGFMAPEATAPIAGLLAVVTLSYVLARRPLRFSEWVQPQLPRKVRRQLANGQTMPPTPATLTGWFIRSALGVPLTIQLLMTGAFAAGIIDSMAIMSLMLLPLAVDSSVRRADPLLKQMGHLPISRRLMARWVLLPPLVLLTLGTFIGEGARRTLHTPELEEISFEAVHEAENSSIQPSVPDRLMRLQVGSEPTRIEAPWGEVARVEPVPMGGILPNVYAVNSYGLAEDSSHEFVAWQFSNAIRDTFGINKTPADLLAICPPHGASQLYVMQLGDFLEEELLEDSDTLHMSPAGDMLETSLILVLIMWAVTSWWATRKQLPDRSGRHWFGRLRQQSRHAPGCIWILAFGVSVFGPNRQAPAPLQALSRELHRSIDGARWVLWICLALVAWACLAGLARRYERMELPLTLKSVWVKTPKSRK